MLSWKPLKFASQRKLLKLIRSNADIPKVSQETIHTIPEYPQFSVTEEIRFQTVDLVSPTITIITGPNQFANAGKITN